MIPKKEIDEIRKYLDKAENPLFFFDDDADGLCSYLLLKKYIDKGKGVVVKRSPELGIEFYPRIKDFSPDLVFILDRPAVSQEFIDKISVPIIWLDHHEPVKKKGVHYYNPKKKDPEDRRPTSYWAYEVAKDNLWIGMVGCVSDWFIPDFKDEFIEQYPDLFPKDIDEPGEAYITKGIGDLVRIFNFILKGTPSEAIKNANILARIESPYEILKQSTPKGRYIFRVSEKNAKSFNSLMARAEKTKAEGSLFLFSYKTDKVSYTSYISNILLGKNPDKLIIIAREDGDYMKMSLRSKDIKVLPILKKALKEVDGYGGGHLYACGAGVKKESFKRFIEVIKSEVNE